MIEVIPMGGLGNRLRVIASAISLSQATHEPLIIHWRKNAELNCSYDELFNWNGAYHVQENLTLANRLLNLTKRVISLRKKVFVSNNEIYTNRNSGWSKERFDDFFFRAAQKNNLVIETDWCFYSYKSSHFPQPTQEILSEINTVTSKYRSPIYGVHIRRTDHDLSIRESPTELFIETMEREIAQNPLTQFFVATDNAVIMQDIKTKFREAVISYSNEKSRETSLGIKEALIDMFCLAATKKIYGSYWSSFSEIASEIGAVPLVIVKK
ncbi:MAG TPA: hypothetical protein VIN08_11590 [Ohtaekwangia sp.]|uniref:hypothetical protein n=1 Tax=Ohtaekwangia sp. TaxID=2066019 RepID=UPI002F943AD6